MIKQEDCHHNYLKFTDGDYHIACQDCGLKWAVVNQSTEGEFTFPEGACKGVGAGLSGDIRGAAL
jgi:hypothetical protein